MADLFDDLATPVDSASERARASLGRNLPKKFYSHVSYEETPEGWHVLLDGKPLKTPARNTFVLPSERLAASVAAEWLAQGPQIDPATMPLTRLANSAIDGIANHPNAVADDLAAYAGTDMLCYRAETPDRLVERQTRLWNPILAEVETRHGLRFRLAAGVMPVNQDAEISKKISDLLPRDPFRLAGLHSVTTLSGSVLIALALANRSIDPEAAWTAAHVDEDWNIELWGEDDETRARRAYRRNEYDAAVQLINY
jgi:chaperone required for assembly of F1-ATPase